MKVEMIVAFIESKYAGEIEEMIKQKGGQLLSIADSFRDKKIIKEKPLKDKKFKKPTVGPMGRIILDYLPKKWTHKDLIKQEIEDSGYAWDSASRKCTDLKRLGLIEAKGETEGGEEGWWRITEAGANYIHNI